jgi:Chaperone of endosialidase
MNLFRLKNCNYTNQKFNGSALLLVVPVLACFAISPMALAVGPDTGGAIPGANTGEGIGVLTSLTNGIWNTGTGFVSLRNNTSGNFNTANGGGSLFFNTTGQRNTATGAGALLSNTTGGSNTANGAFALLSNTTGTFNTATGDSALFHNTLGSYNTAVGDGALTNNTDGPGNTATGALALSANTIGEANTATGVAALFINTTGSNNTADGWNALNVSTGSGNTAAGYKALINSTTGDNNTAVGNLALAFSGTGSGNVALGTNAGSNVTTVSNVICIGSNVPAANVSNTCFIGNIFGVTTGMDAVSVVVDTNGQLGTVASSRRFKRDIQPMDKTSEAILSFKPVTFHYKNDPAGAGPQFGLVAEDVAKVDPDLVVRDKNGEIYTVRYDAVNAMLLNEFLKEHRMVQEQQAEIDVLKAELKQQRALIQKVSAQLELSKPSPRTVLNDQ